MNIGYSYPFQGLQIFPEQSLTYTMCSQTQILIIYSAFPSIAEHVF